MPEMRPRVLHVDNTKPRFAGALGKPSDGLERSRHEPSVAAALAIGMIELLQVTVGLRVLDPGKIGYLVVALFFATWAVSVVYWKARRVEERCTG